MRRLVAAALAAALLAGCATRDPDTDGYGGARRPPLPAIPERPSELPTSAPAPTPPPTCPPEGVLLRPGPADAAAGLRALAITLLNCGHQDYRVDGYPVVHVQDRNHRTLRVEVLRGTTPITGPIPEWNGPPRPLTLHPGQQAACVVAWRNTYDDIRQPPVTAPFLAMAPAAGRPARILTPDVALDLGSTGRLGVSPWRLSRPAGQVTRPTAPPAAPPSTQPSPPSPIL